MKKTAAEKKAVSPLAGSSAFRAAGAAFAAAILVCTASGCGGNFDAYDDTTFDFPDKAAPPVANPIPYEPDQAASPDAGSSSENSEVMKSEPESLEDSEKKAVPGKAKSRKLPPPDSGVQTIGARRSGEGGTAPSSPSDEGIHPKASQELDKSSEGPGRAAPAFLPPPKNVDSFRRGRFNDPHFQEKLNAAERRRTGGFREKFGRGGHKYRKSSGLSSARDGN